MGYSREAAIWLARLTTSALPANIPFLKKEPSAVLPYLRRHLPQGAPTSPALANLSAYSLDVRLSGLARAFGATYTRYADDLTFSGPEAFSRSLRDFIPLVSQIIRQERFRVNKAKRKVIRANRALVVTGIVVNRKLNIRRRQYDRLKAVLHNCVQHGPSSQNRGSHPRFAASPARPHRLRQPTQCGPRREVARPLQSHRLEALAMRDILLDYIFRPLARPLTRFIVSLAALPALHFIFRHVHSLERLDDEVEKDLAEWFRGSFLLLLVTANVEAALWHNVIPLPDLLDKHGWLGLGLRIMLAIGVVQLMPDQELFTIIHPGPRLPRFRPGRSRLAANCRLLEAVRDRTFSASTSAARRRYSRFSP